MSVSDKMWVERFRPDTLDEVIGHRNLVNLFKGYLEQSDPPNVMLAGPQGVGKTALFTSFAKDMYGDEWRSNMLELNASDQRGIDVVREQIKDYARTGVVGDYPFKIIMLDECDSMTNDAQSALRRTMEDFSSNTRFFMSCNFPNQISAPIRSRCAVFHVGQLEDEDIETVVRRVAEAEDLEISESGIDAIIADARGDARKAINSLQGAKIDGEVSVEGIEAVTAGVSKKEAEAIIEEAVAGDLDGAMRKLDSDILKAGVSAQAFVERALEIVKDMDIPEDARAKAIDKAGECDWRLKNGANPNIQLHKFLADVMVARHLSLPGYDEDGGGEVSEA